MEYNYIWINMLTTLPETSNTLLLTDVTDETIGTYECAVSNVAGTGMASITIGLVG